MVSAVMGNIYENICTLGMGGWLGNPAEGHIINCTQEAAIRGCSGTQYKAKEKAFF